MQRKALKQLNKVTQWTNEKVFSSERTQFSEDFAEFETEIEPLRKGIERLHATSVPFFEQLTKLKPSADPYRPSGSKDKMRATEALGLVMIDYGNDAGGEYGDGLVKYGRARCKLAIMQEEFGERLNDGYIQATEAALASVNEYKLYRKKMDSRRLTLDSALSRAKASKKENPALEQEVELAQQRLDETEEETKLRMMAIKENEAAQFASLADLVDAELEFFTRCKEILEDLRDNFPTGYSGGSSRSKPEPRARARSNSARSGGRAAGGFSGSPDSDDEEAVSSRTPKSGNRSRSDSTASAGAGAANKPKSRGIMSSIGSIGSFGAKTASKTASKATKGFRKKDGEALASEDEERSRDRDDVYTSPNRPVNNRARSQSVVSVVTGLGVDTTPRRRALTSPSSPVGSFVKVLYDFEGLDGDELPLRVGQVVEVKQEVSADWAIGECEGMSGLFPRAYTEEYIPSPTVLAPSRRGLPPPVRRQSSAPSFTTDDDTDADSIADNDDKRGLAAAAQPPPTNRTRSSSIKKAAPPPPPPSRRSQSSNMLSMAAGTRSPPPPVSRSRSSTITRTNAGLDAPYHSHSQAQSPFAHSDDESSMHGGCAVCGCSDFTQNVFKAKGTCSTCFHQH